MSKTSNSIAAFLSGAAIGAGVALLYAPEKGEVTRKRIGEKADKAKDSAKDQWLKTSSNLSESTQKAKNDFGNKLDDVLSSASYKADDIIYSLEKRLAELRKKNKEFYTDKYQAKETKSKPASKSTAKKTTKKAKTTGKKS